MEWLLTNLTAALLLPPLNLLLLLGAGLLLLRCCPKIANTLLVAGFGLLWLLSTPFVVESGMHWLESGFKPVMQPDADEAQAIVILGGSLYFHALYYKLPQ